MANSGNRPVGRNPQPATQDPEAQAPAVSIIVPSWTGEVGRLTDSIRQQTFQDYALEIVSGVSPAARARNVGVARTRGEILLFVDDDAFFGSKHVIENLVRVLREHPNVGVVGTSKLAPPTATPLQKAIARQVPRQIFPVVPRDIESDPPLKAYGFTAVSTTCCAVRRSVYEEVGGFDEELTTGPEDTDFFYRIGRKGHKTMVAANSWVYHDPPGSVKDLLRKSFWYGIGHSLEAHKSPERRMNVLPLDRWYGVFVLVAAVFAFPFSFFIHYYFDPVRRIEIGFRPLKALSSYAVLCGYVYGWYHGAPRKPANTYMGRKGAAGEGAPSPTGDTQPAMQSSNPKSRAQSPKSTGPARILYLDAYPKFGGGQRVLYSIVTRLDRGRYSPLVAVPAQNPFRERLAEAGIRSVGIDFRESNYRMPSFMRPLSVPLTILSMVHVIRQIAVLARRTRADLIHANSAVVGVHAVPAAALLGLPVVVQAHDFNTAQLTNRLLTLLMRYKKASMIFVSQALANHYEAGRHSYPYRVIHNGVDVNVFCADPTARQALIEELGLPTDSFVIGAVGRLERWKGFDLLIEAFATVATDHPQARLLIVGDVVFDQLRSVKDDLVQLARDLGISDRVIFTGFRSDVPRIMAAIDLLVHYPRDPEGFGMILAEAMACGRPIVTVATGGAVEQVTDGVNGFLVPPEDVQALADATSRMVANPDMAKRMGEAGRRIVEERLTLDKQADEIDRFYQEILARDGRAAGEATVGHLKRGEQVPGGSIGHRA